MPLLGDAHAPYSYRRRRAIGLHDPQTAMRSRAKQCLPHASASYRTGSQLLGIATVEACAAVTAPAFLSTARAVTGAAGFASASLVATSAPFVVGRAVPRGNGDSRGSPFKGNRNCKVIHLTRPLRAALIANAAPNARVQRVRERQWRKH